MTSTVEQGRSRSGVPLTVQALPARQGDCVLVEWSHGGRVRRLLVDAGPAHAYAELCDRLARLDVHDADVLVLTHIDADHIEGAILLLNDNGLQFTPRDVWYNGARQLPDQLGAAQGEIFGLLVDNRGLPWNGAFHGAGIVTREGEPLPTTRLVGAVDVTVLAPSVGALRRLRDEWSRVWSAAGLDMGSEAAALAALRSRPKLSPLESYLAAEEAPDVRHLARVRAAPDTSVSNASSIVLLLESGEQRVLLAGDSTPAVLLPAVRRLLTERGTESLTLSDFKLPHHGSAKNLDAELVRRLPARRYHVSSDGSFFRHPDDSAIAQVLEYGPRGLELVFNYDTPRNRRWADPALRRVYGHEVSFPAPVARTPR
jgi:beta-lactamase superfamily II metal-dependent hydrolase